MKKGQKKDMKKTNLELLGNTVETSAAVYTLEKLVPVYGGMRWAVRIHYKHAKNEKGFNLINETLYARTKKDAVALFEELVPAVTMAFVKGFCLDHSGKMAGMISFSTSCLLNARCLKRMKDGNSICSECFAAAQLAWQGTNRDKLAKNTALVTSTVYSHSYIPVFKNWDKIRLESFGDLNNETQAENYIRIAEVNNHATVALWTKNPDILYKALEKRGFNKPKNFIVIYSSPCINVCADHIRKLYTMPDGKSMIDKVFTVYDSEHAAAAGINCGAKCCKTCKRCYNHRTAANVKELLREQHKEK